ncbi:MAG: hypothetical protein ACR2KW_08190 [Rubrobacter sp.]
MRRSITQTRVQRRVDIAAHRYIYPPPLLPTYIARIQRQPFTASLNLGPKPGAVAGNLLLATRFTVATERVAAGLPWTVLP